MRNKLLIVLGVVGTLIVIGIVIAITAKKDKSTTNSPTGTEATGSSENSDFVGMTGDCKPLDSNQWYRTDATLTVSPTNDQIIGVFVEKRGFFRSIDGGQTWKYLSKGIKGFQSSDTPEGRPCYLEFRAAHIGDTNPERLLLGALGDFGTITSAFNKAGGLLESTDGGTTWNQILTDGLNAYVHGIAVDPTNPDVIYYVTSNQKGMSQTESLLKKGLVYKTTNGGKTWEELPTGLAENTAGQEIFIDPANPSRLVVATATFSGVPGSRTAAEQALGILVTEDGGLTWQSFKSIPTGEAILESFAAPTKIEHMYFSIMSDAGSKSYYSKDMGKTVTKSGMAMDVVAYDPSDTTGNKMLGYSWQSGSKSIFESTNAGATWQVKGAIPTDITNIQDPKQRISKIVISKTNSKTVYMSGADAKVWGSTDGGLTWTSLLSLEKLP